ncbi:FG-GAP-like repeat-containing protein [Corallibacter sp.]|uniref:FG-GAP-like repeat-containing protein n=1 Tax=Corallibacter sp. TaxID=2038084 RepID=UPI003AB1EE3E
MKKITLLFASVFYSLLFYAQDDCNSAIAVTAGTHTVTQINGTQGTSIICAGTGNGSRAEWYTFTPTIDANVTVSTSLAQNSGGDTRIQIYEGACNSLNCVGGDDDSGNVYLSIASFNATANTTYYIAFDNRWSSSGFDFEITLDDPLPPPPFSFSGQTLATTGSTMGIVDMNGDFLDDIIAIPGSGGVYNLNIYYQQINGTFVSESYTPQASRSPTWSLAVGDIDANGYNDLIFGNSSGCNIIKANHNGSAYTTVYDNSGVFTQRTNFVDINNDGHLDVFVCHDVDPSVYYLNDGNGNLTFYRSPEIGTSNSSPYQLGAYYSGGNYGSIWIDYDNDRNLDMFMAKCGGAYPRYVNQMHRNTGTDYVENASDIGLADGDQTWSAAWGDFDNDGDLDVFVGASSGPHVLKANNGAPNYTFTDITSSSGVSALTTTSREHVTYDLDNDGYLDIISGNNVLRNNGDMTFTPYLDVFSGSGAFGDLNNDGFIDAYRGSSVYLNDGNNNNWIKVTVEGGATTGMSNRNGIGARIELHTPSGVQIRDIRSGEGFEFMNTLNAHFGLGTETQIDNIIIYWPSGIIDNVYSPSINQTIKVNEGETLTVQDETLSNLTIYPNPVKDIINLQSNENLTSRIATVFDINGKKVLNQRLQDNTMNVSKLQSGFYILRLESQGKVVNRKFIKE